MSTIIKFEEKKQEIDYYKTLAAIAAKSGTTQMSPEIMLNIMLTAKDLGISPLKAVNGGFYIVNGKISMSTCLMADRIRKEGHSIKIPEWTAQKCAVLGTRKDNGDSVRFEFTIEDAQAAGLTGSPTWKKFPKQMLYNRAMSTLARTLFPDVVGNAYSEDEKYDIMDVPPAQRPLEDPDCIEVGIDNDSQIVDRLDALKANMEIDGIDTKFLSSYILDLSSKHTKDSNKIIEAALKEGAFPKFKAAYLRFATSQSPQEEVPA